MGYVLELGAHCDFALVAERFYMELKSQLVKF